MYDSLYLKRKRRYLFVVEYSMKLTYRSLPLLLIVSRMSVLFW